MVAEIALSFVLFIGAALLVKSFHQLTAIDPDSIRMAFSPRT
jgi:hypothetical protein